MKIIFGKAGGLVVNTRKFHFCIFPANVWFARSKNVVVVFKIGFSLTRIRNF